MTEEREDLDWLAREMLEREEPDRQAALKKLYIKKDMKELEELERKMAEIKATGQKRLEEAEANHLKLMEQLKNLQNSRFFL